MKFLIFLSEAMVPLMIFYIVGFGLLSGRPVLDDFIDGAKDGMKTVAGILPTLVLDIFKEYGTDSSLGLIASVLMSSTETVLYCLSVYFGSVGITRTRYTLAGGLIATAAGVAASVVLAGAVR